MNIDKAALRKRGSPLGLLFDRVEPGKSSFKNPVKKSWKTVDGLPQRGDLQARSGSILRRAASPTNLFRRPQSLQVFNFQKAVQLADARGVAHFAERLGLDLPDAFPGDAELLPNFLERARATVAQTKTQFQHLPLALGQTAQHVAEFVLEQAETGDVEGIVGGLVLDEIAEVGVIGVADR